MAGIFHLPGGKENACCIGFIYFIHPKNGLYQINVSFAQMKQFKNLVAVNYSHPEYYPPTLNALEYLSGEYDNIYMVHRNLNAFDWIYPSNVHLVPSGKKIHFSDAEQAGTLKKIFFFLGFTATIFKTIRRARPDTILVYDFMPILSLYFLTPFIKKPRVLWYHNHDMGDEKYMRKWSISWFAWKSEKWLFPRLTVFSLPAVERKVFFPMEKLKGQFFFLPNFPSKKVYGAIKPGIKKNDDGDIKLLYQGSIGALHGLEEIIPLLKEKISGRNMVLVLKGFVRDGYLQELEQLAAANGVKDKLLYLPPSGYREVIENAFTCHIGIGIHKKQDIMNNTLGTASNKIYEYAATGMPVLIYDNAHFRATLGSREWVFFTDTENASLLAAISNIISNYDALSKKATTDFTGELCFENYIKPVIEFLKVNKTKTNAEHLAKIEIPG